MTYETLDSDHSHTPAYLLYLNRPEAANALNTQMGLDLQNYFKNLPANSRAVVITGKGKHFCAGADLKERKGMTEAQWHTQHDAFEEALHAIINCPVPIIAAVRGAAFGGGLELALACDFIYASPAARFGLTETTLGIMPGLGGMYQLGKRAGLARAKELIYTGAPFSAQQAESWGIVNRLTSEEDVAEQALETAQKIAAGAPLAVRAVKQAAHECENMPLKEALAKELEYYNGLLSSKDRHEGINAFNEKRKAAFIGE